MTNANILWVKIYTLQKKALCMCIETVFYIYIYIRFIRQMSTNDYYILFSIVFLKKNMVESQLSRQCGGSRVPETSNLEYFFISLLEWDAIFQ